MTTELTKGSHPHALQEVSVRAPCFCAHCGHIIPIAGPADENFKCHGTPPELVDGAEMLIRGAGCWGVECGIYVHGDCEAYLPSLCGLDRARALQISQSYLARCQEALLARSSIHSLKPSLWTPYDERQFEFVAVLGKGNFGKVGVPVGASDKQTFDLNRSRGTTGDAGAKTGDGRNGGP